MRYIFISLFLLTFSLYGNAEGVVLTKKEQLYLQNHKTITVHNEEDWAPYNFNINNTPQGFSIDYIKLLAKKLNINIKFISHHTWREFMQMIKDEKIDVISNIAKTKKREEFVNFTTPFISLKKAIFSNIPNIEKLSDLNGKIVAVPDQFYIHKYLQKNYPNIKLKVYKNSKECLYGVANQEADALIENYAIIYYIIKQERLNIKYITIKDDDELTSYVSLGVRKSQVILRDILQKAMDSVTQEEFEQLEDKWFGLKKNDQFLTQKDKQYLKEKKVLKVCTNPNWTPIEFIQDGEPKGISIDILKLITKKLNLQTQFVKTTSWKESQEFLKEKRCDILSSAIKTDQRESYANFTEPYLSYDLAIVTKNDKPLVDKLSDIVDKPMSRKAYSGISMLLKQLYPNIVIYDTENMIEAFYDIQDGKSYFTLATLPILSYNRKRYDLNNLQVAGYSELKYNLCIAVRNDDKQLVNILNKTIKTIPKETIKVINEKWTTQDVIKQVNYTLIWIILFVASVIVLITYIAYRKQKMLRYEIKLLNNSLEDKVKKEVEKNKQQQLMMLQQSRLAQMGEMISMIAHQWRQPLNTLAMLNQSLILKYQMGKLDDEFMEHFKTNSKYQISNMSKTIDDFRDFFKPQKAKQEFCINDIINNTLEMVKPIFTINEIKVVLDMDECYTLYGYPNELGQAILNIINNSKDALITKNISDKTIFISLQKQHNDIILIIEDNAGGIPANIIDKIFDPYFSTKEEKNGTGLGLYMTRIIIQEHLNGEIKVTNTKKGAQFKLILFAGHS